MGNCSGTTQKKKSTAEITPSGFTKPHPSVKLYGSPTSYLTSYIRFALLLKPVSLHFIPSDDDDAPVIQFGSDVVVSGSPLTLLRYVDDKFPKPQLMSNWSRFNETTPLVVTQAMLQHRSVAWHLERMVRWGQDLAARGGKSRGDPVMGTPRMEVRKYAKSYSQLLEVMLEHAQMEERVVFPILERADRGLCKAANEEHARDLPIMNGIKEDIKAIGVLDSGSPVYQEALLNLSTRLRTLQEHCKQHFEEEERELLSLMEAAELSKGDQERLLEKCLDVMHSTHTHLFRFFIEGLLPQDAMLYLDLISRCTDKDRVSSIFSLIVD